MWPNPTFSSYKSSGSKRSKLLKDLIVDLKINLFASTLKHSDPYKTIFKSSSSG